MTAALIAAAESVLKPHTTKADRRFGDVGAAVLSATGRLFTSVSVDMEGWGLCAERSALATILRRSMAWRSTLPVTALCC